MTFNQVKKITGPELEHWMSVLGEGAVLDPPTFSRCAAHERESKSTAAKGGQASLLRRCAETYETLRKKALSFLVSVQWLLAQTELEGHPVREQEVQAKLEETQREAYPGGAAEFRESLEQSGQTISDYRLKTAGGLAAERVHRAVVASEVPITAARINGFYVAKMAEFQIPEVRRIAIIERYTKQAAMKAKSAIEHGSTVKSQGPLYESFKSTANIEPIIFSSRPHTLVGPVKLPASWSVFEVTSVVPPSYETPAEARAAITTRLKEEDKALALSRFMTRFANQWSFSTLCIQGFIIPQCFLYGQNRTSAMEDPFKQV